MANKPSIIVDHHGNPIQSASTAAYKGGEISRLTKDWMPAHRSGDGAIRENWDLLTARVRDLFRNEPVIRSARRSLAKYTIGPGIQTFAAAMMAGSREEMDDDWNTESDDEFDSWSDDEADVEGRLSWPEMQWAHFCQVAEVGESVLLKCQDKTPGRSVPLCYQLLEAEQIDNSKDWPAAAGRNRCVRGIEYDARNRMTGMWLYDAHPYDTWSGGYGGDSTLVPADRLIHTYLAERPSQHRGVTWFGCNIQSNRDLDWYIGNEMTAAAIGALLTLVVKRKNGAGTGLGFGTGEGADDTSDEYGNNKVKLGRGIVADIGSEDDIKVAESNRPNRDAAPFLKLIMMLQGMGVGMSYLRMTGDYSQSSYTSARGAHLDDQAFFIVLQNWFGRSVVRPIRRAHTEAAVAYGQYESITPVEFKKRKKNYLKFDVQPPGREQLDPEKETDAALKRIDGGLSTWKDECGLRGKHWRRVAIQRARELKFMGKLADGLGMTTDAFVSTKPKAQGPQRTPEPAPNPDAIGTFEF